MPELISNPSFLLCPKSEKKTKKQRNLGAPEQILTKHSQAGQNYGKSKKKKKTGLAFHSFVISIQD